MKRILLGTILAALTACGKQGTPFPVMKGIDKTPYTKIGMDRGDGRFVAFACPSCGKEVDVSMRSCTNVTNKKNCKAKLKWVDQYPCPNCRGSGFCQACLVYGHAGLHVKEEDKGKCWKCGGAGWTRDNVQCANCWVDDTTYGKCVICSGTALCDWCENKNEGKISQAELEKRSEPPKAPPDSGPETDPGE